MINFEQLKQNVLEQIKDRYVELDVSGKDDLTRLTSGLHWFMIGSTLDREAPTRHAIRIGDIIVARSSALMVHISIMLAVSLLIFQNTYFRANTIDIFAPFLAVETLLYLVLTLLCLQTIHITGERTFQEEDSCSKRLLEELNDIAAADRNSLEAKVVNYYANWKDANGNTLRIDEGFVRFTFAILARQRAYLRALISTYAVTILFLLTLMMKFIVQILAG